MDEFTDHGLDYEARTICHREEHKWFIVLNYDDYMF